MLDPSLLQRLRSLVGRSVEYRGKRCRVIEILDSEQALVVECQDQPHVIQGNQYGEATRRVPESRSMPLFDEQQRLHPLIRSWLDD